MRLISYVAAVLAAGSLFFAAHIGWPWHEPYSTSPVAVTGAVSSRSNFSSGAGQPPQHTSGVTSTPTPTPASEPKKQNNPPATTTQAAPAPASGEIYLTAYTTSYAAGDNDPAGSTITYISGQEGNAGGTGTYTDPITLAVGYVGETPDIPAGTKFYIPNVRRYFIAADTCAECHETPKGAQVWVDMYAGDYSGEGVLACEDDITGDYTIIENPSPVYAVVQGSLYNGTSCTAQYGDTPVAGG